MASVSVDLREERQEVEVQMCVETDVLDSPVESEICSCECGVCFCVPVPLNYFKCYYSMAAILLTVFDDFTLWVLLFC